MAYTWSHAIDESQGNAGANIYFTDPPATVYNGNYQAERGTSTLDQRHRLVVSAIIAPPRKDFGMNLFNHLANGWQLSIIETAASPQYTDPIIIVAGALTPGLASSTTINGMVTAFGAPGRAPFAPRSSVAIDSVNKLDGRVTKTFKLPWEATSVALSFEAFNIFNTISNTSVNTTAYRAVGTVITQAAGLGSGTASGGFPDGTNARRAQVSARFTF